MKKIGLSYTFTIIYSLILHTWFALPSEGRATNERTKSEQTPAKNIAGTVDWPDAD